MWVAVQQPMSQHAQPHAPITAGLPVIHPQPARHTYMKLRTSITKAEFGLVRRPILLDSDALLALNRAPRYHGWDAEDWLPVADNSAL